jgi:hypothetical protein
MKLDASHRSAARTFLMSGDTSGPLDREVRRLVVAGETGRNRRGSLDTPTGSDIDTLRIGRQGTHAT